MSQIGIIGGTFDPPHVGHLIIAEEVRLALELDEVWFIPTNVPPHKEAAMTSGENRVKMVKKAIRSNRFFKVNEIEMERDGKSYTIDTMRLLIERNPETEFYFILGADMVESLHEWDEIEELRQLVQFVGVKREGYYLKAQFPIIEIPIPMVDISSTMIKRRLMNDQTVTYLIPESVEKFINQEQLYGTR